MIETRALERKIAEAYLVNLMGYSCREWESRDWRGPKQHDEASRNRGFHVAILFSNLIEVCPKTSR
jgi:hypothetical protein